MLLIILSFAFSYTSICWYSAVVYALETDVLSSNKAEVNLFEVILPLFKDICVIKDSTIQYQIMLK